MSAKGNCYDNAVAENFFSNLKTEVNCKFYNLHDAETSIFDIY
ncbi:IS1501 transposase [endosymbiont of Acanthamoeba sp. UWC8]|nr:IS1501 transposase [endosymbiont of Acanthamoeba sp. UWC8]